MPTKIILPLDGSPLAEKAIPLAEELALALHADLVLVTVGELAETKIHAREEAGELRGILEAAATRISMPARLRIEESGDPATGILRAIDQEGADMVVMSTHGRSGLSELAQGSVANEVIRKAKIPVILKRPI